MKLMLNGKEVSGMGHYVMAGDIKDATAEDSNVLSGKTYYNNNGKREGIMPNRGGMSAELAAGGSVSIPEGYHNGEGVVRAQDLASQTQGSAAAANIEAGYTAWVNGEMVEGLGSMGLTREIRTRESHTANKIVPVKQRGWQIVLIPKVKGKYSSNVGYIILQDGVSKGTSGGTGYKCQIVDGYICTDVTSSSGEYEVLYTE